MTTSFPGVIAGALLTILTSYALGLLMLRSLAPQLTLLEYRIFSYFAGAAALSAIVFSLCAAQLARKGIFLSVAIIAAVLAATFIARNAPKTQDPALLLDKWMARFLLLLYVSFGLIYVINAAAPEYSPDGATYHLGNVVRWWTDRGFTKYTGSLYANWSQGLEMLFLFGFPIGGHSAAALVHLSFLLVLPWSFLAFGRRIGQPLPMAIAGMILYLSPVVGRAGSSAYNDIAVICALFALFQVLQIWAANRDPRLIALAALFAGFGYCLKYTAGFGVVYGLLVIAWTLRRESWKRQAPPLLFFAGIASVCLAPWLIKNLIWLGNPLSPFFNELFPNPYIHISFERGYSKGMSLYEEIPSRWHLPAYYAYRGTYVGGIFGPWLFLLPVALFALRQPVGRHLLAAGAIAGVGAFFNCGTRFVLPLAVFWAPALLLVLSHFPRASLALLAFHAVLSLPSVVALYAGPHTWRIDRLPWAAALRLEDESKFLSDRMDAFPMARLLDSRTPKDAKIFTLAQVPVAYTSRRLWNSWESAEAELAYRAMHAGGTPALQAGWEVDFHFAPARLTAIRVIAERSNEDAWGVSELYVERDGRPIPRGTSWRLSAQPNPWDAPLAFDNNELTAWATWDRTESGSFLQAGLESPVELDHVKLLTPRRLSNGAWRVEGLQPDGEWRVLTDVFQWKNHPKPRGARFAAVAALKSMGFTHIVAGEDDDLTRDIAANTEYWGLEHIAKSRALSLLRID